MAGKIQDETEVKRWFDQGKTYKEMVELYATKYHIEVKPSTFGNFRRRHGLQRRITRDDNLIPWMVKPEHRYDWPVMMLRLEGRRRAGLKPLSDVETHKLDTWLANLKSMDAVVHYVPERDEEHGLDAGFHYVAPRPGIDTDIIRVPEHKTTTQPNTDLTERNLNR